MTTALGALAAAADGRALAAGRAEQDELGHVGAERRAHRVEEVAERLLGVAAGVQQRGHLVQQRAGSPAARGRRV